MLPKYPIKAQNATNTESTDVAVFIVPDGAISGNEVDISGSSDPLVYRALLTQSETDAPTATVLENTLGGTVVWTYSDVGVYAGTLAAAFTENKTAVNISGVVGLAAGARNDADTVSVTTFLSDGVSARNEVLSSTYVEILVYP